MSGSISASSHLGGAFVDAGDRVQELELTGERARQLLDLLGQRGDGLVEEVDLGEHLPDEQRVVAGEAPLERLFEGPVLGFVSPAAR
jgi:hypothetical protein